MKKPQMSVEAIPDASVRNGTVVVSLGYFSKVPRIGLPLQVQSAAFVAPPTHHPAQASPSYL